MQEIISSTKKLQQDSSPASTAAAAAALFIKDRESSDPITCQEIKAHLEIYGVENVVEIDMREKSNWTEWFIIAYVDNGRQLKSIIQSLVYQVSK